MKRFILFAGSDYYPEGGAQDIKGSYDTEEEALQEAHKSQEEWKEVLDTSTGEYWAYTPRAGEFRAQIKC